MIERNWYSSRFPSTAIVRPRNASRLVGWRTVIGVSRTPIAPSSLHRGLCGSRRRDRETAQRACVEKVHESRSAAIASSSANASAFGRVRKNFPTCLQILAVDQLAPVLAVVEDRPPDRIELD